MKLRYCLLLCGFLPFPPPRALASPPVQVAARVELQHGAIRIAARNQLAETLPITMRIFSADGAHLPVSSFGLLLPPHGASSHLLPVRNVTLDQPVLHSLLVYARTNLVSLRLPCRSGALFRVATAGYLETSIPRRTTVSLQSTPGGPLQLRVGANPVLTDLAIRLGPHILIPQPLSHGQWLAELTRGSSIVARATLKQRSNNRGDVILNLLTEILAPGLSSDDIPCLTTLIPAPLLSNSLVVARRHGTYLHTPPFSLADPSVNALFSGPSLDEWSLVLPNDWFVWQLDAASLAASCVTNGLLLHITSRSPWQPPLTPGRAHALQFRLHLPVGIIP